MSRTRRRVIAERAESAMSEATLGVLLAFPILSLWLPSFMR